MGHRLRRGRPRAGARQGPQGARRRAVPAFGRSPRDRRRYGLLLRSTCCGRASCARPSAPISRPGCSWRSRPTRVRLGPRRRDSRVRRRGPAVRRRVASTSSSATPSCTTCPTSACAFGRVPARAARRAGPCSSRASRRAYGDRLATVPKRAAAAVAPLWRSGDARGPGARRPRRRRGRPTTTSSRTSTSTPSPPTPWRARPACRGPRRGPRPRRGAARQLVRLGQPRARGDGRPDEGPVGVEGLMRSAAISACRRLTRGLLEPRLPPAIFYNLMLSAQK